MIMLIKILLIFVILLEIVMLKIMDNIQTILHSMGDLIQFLIIVLLWITYDHKQYFSSNVTFRHSASWNKWSVDVFAGKYDYDNGKTLDKNMLTIQ